VRILACLLLVVFLCIKYKWVVAIWYLAAHAWLKS
jgi:hypothetical protein